MGQDKSTYKENYVRFQDLFKISLNFQVHYVLDPIL